MTTDMTKKKTSIAPLSYLDSSGGDSFGDYFDAPSSTPAPASSSPESSGADDASSAGAARVGRARGVGRKAEPVRSPLVTVKIPSDLKARLDAAKSSLLVTEGRSYSYGDLIDVLLDRGLKGLSRAAWDKYRAVLSALYGPLD